MSKTARLNLLLDRINKIENSRNVSKKQALLNKLYRKLSRGLY